MNNDSLSPRELKILSEVEGEQDITQRELSRRLGIALGLTNILLRNLTQKGYLRVVQSTWKRRLYTLTPEGFAHRLRLMVGYVSRFLEDYKNVRETLKEQLSPLSLNEESRVAIYGIGEFAELVYMGLRESGIDEIDVFDAVSAPNVKFLGMPIQPLLSLDPNQYEWVLVGRLTDLSQTRAFLIENGVKPEILITFFEDGTMNGRGEELCESGT